MSIKRLEREGFLLPREARGRLDLRGTVGRGPLLLLAVLGGFCCILMYLGDGHTWSWVGGVGFLLFLVGFLWLMQRAVSRQVRRTEALFAEHPSAAGGAEGSEPS
jgi:hypothetical protein